jgi:NAD(P)-dependent dehydrogenase (short-subunit alcohol dehydrogenase family)
MKENIFSLENKTILVTGASSGIGKGISIDTSKNGANLIITARNNQRLSETYELLSGNNNLTYVADLCELIDIDNLVEKLPVLDGIVLCAGIIKTMPVKNITDRAIEEIFNTNIISNIQLLKRLLKKKKIAHGASIVFISSVSTFNVKVGNSLYSATKGAMNSFAKAMALEVARQNMRVNTIQPGFIPSNILNKSGIQESEILKWYAERHPLGFGTSSDIANACIYLLSDASRWVTGSIFTIDGGYTLQ